MLFDVMDFAYKKGVRYFDTAPSYGLGEQFLLDLEKTVDNIKTLYYLQNGDILMLPIGN